MATQAAVSAISVAAVQLASFFGYEVPPGLAMMLVAPGVVHLGAMKAAYSLNVKKDQPPVSQQDAIAMPFIAGAALVGLYFAFKHFDLETVNKLLLVYFTLIGTGSWAGMAWPIVAKAVSTKPLITIPAIPYVLPDPLPVSLALLVSTVVGSFVPALYARSKHWLANNAMGMGFVIEGLALVDLGDWQAGAMMLGGLFVYDIFMVFGTKKLMSGGPSVMEKVATSVEGPIKLIFPLGAQAAVGKERPYSLLGLGDILVPGLYLILLLRFDAYKAATKGFKSKPTGQVVYPPLGTYPMAYFNAGFLAYVLGLGATIAALHWAETAQPALLYLCPLCGLLPVLVAWAQGDLAELVAFKTVHTPAGPTGTGDETQASKDSTDPVNHDKSD